MVDGKEASHDDITAVVVPLHLVASSTNVTLSPGNAQLTQSTWFSCAWWLDMIVCGMFVAVQLLIAFGWDYELRSLMCILMQKDHIHMLKIL